MIKLKYLLSLVLMCWASFGSAATIRVPAGSDLQIALNSANSGDTLVLDAGATYVGNFLLRNRGNLGYITITSSHEGLLPPDRRVTPAAVVYMPTIITPNNMPAIATALGAQRYRLIGLHVRPAADVYVFDLINIGDAYTKDIAMLAREIELDRLYIHGNPVLGGKRGITLNGAETTVKNSWIADFKSHFQDSQAIAGWNGPGPFVILNNFLEASGENIMFGGAAVSILNVVPSDIVIERNHFFKPLSWNPAHPSYKGQYWVVKNLLEFKNGRRVRVRGNVFQNCWEAQQKGYGVVLTVRTEGGQVPWAVNEDLTIEYNIFRNVLKGGSIHGMDDDGFPGQTNRIAVRNNVFEHVGTLLMLQNGIQNLTIDHNTILAYGDLIISLGGSPGSGFIFTNNIMNNNLYGVHGDGVGMGTVAFRQYYDTYKDERNALIGAPSYAYSAEDFFPADVSSVGFQDTKSGDYRLSASSPYKQAGTDGADLGANIDYVTAATAGVVVDFQSPDFEQISVQVTPGSVNVNYGGTRQFFAAVIGSGNVGVTWSLAPSVGSISSTGLYTAPASVSGAQTAGAQTLITATSVADGSKSATATITLVEPVSVEVSPGSATLAPGGTQQLIAVVTGGLGSTAVTWTVSPNVGSVSSGLYTAPATITTQLIVTVTATSIVDTSKSAKSTITITQPGPAVTLNSVSCTPSVIFAPGTAACSVALSGPAPSGGFVVRLAADSANVTVPGSVTVLPGNISAGFATVVAFSMVGQTSIMASANGVSQMFSLSVSSRALVSVGIFRQGFFWLFDMNGDRQFDVPPDKGFAFGGLPGDMPITGDWNGSGSSKAGIFRASSGVFVLDYNGDGLYTSADKTYNFGVGAQPGDVPVVGDWSGDGLTKIGLFRQGYFWILDTNGNGIFEQGVDQSTAFGGVTGDVPVVGDWNGSGRSKLGLVRMGFFWILDHNGDGSLDNVNLGGGDKAFAFGGISGDVPVVGDWNGDGRAKPGVFRGGFFWVLDVNGNYQFDGTGVGQDLAFSFGGIADDKPIVGRWGG